MTSLLCHSADCLYWMMISIEKIVYSYFLINEAELFQTIPMIPLNWPFLVVGRCIGKHKESTNCYFAFLKVLVSGGICQKDTMQFLLNYKNNQLSKYFAISNMHTQIKLDSRALCDQGLHISSSHESWVMLSEVKLILIRRHQSLPQRRCGHGSIRACFCLILSNIYETGIESTDFHRLFIQASVLLRFPCSQS